MSSQHRGRLFYHRLPDFARKESKLDFLSENSLSSVDWQRLVPNQKHTWLRTDTEDEFACYLPIGSKEAKRAKPEGAETIFKTYSGGVVTRRDAFVYDFSASPMLERMRQQVDDYNTQVAIYQQKNPKPNIDDFVSYESIKWDNVLKTSLRRQAYGSFDVSRRRISTFRPYTKKCLYFDKLFVSAVCLQHRFFPDEPSESENRLIVSSDIGYRADVFSALICDSIPEAHLLASTDSHQCFPFYTYDEDGSNHRENITDWALSQFRSQYNDPAISKWDIFYYVYGILHHPGYRERYALDLKRNLPRIPFAPAFRPYADAGAQLADLHLNYESADRYELDWQSTRTPVSYRVEKMLPRGKVDSIEGAYKVYSTLQYNEALTLRDIPERAFAYRLGTAPPSIGSSTNTASKPTNAAASPTIPTATATTRNTSSSSSSASSPSACAPSTSLKS